MFRILLFAILFCGFWGSALAQSSPLVMRHADSLAVMRKAGFLLLNGHVHFTHDCEVNGVAGEFIAFEGEFGGTFKGDPVVLFIEVARVAGDDHFALGNNHVSKGFGEFRFLVERDELGADSGRIDFCRVLFLLLVLM